MVPFAKIQHNGRRPRRRDHKFGFEIVELENIQDTEVEMSNKRLKVKGLCQRYKFENHCI